MTAKGALLQALAVCGLLLGPNLAYAKGPESVAALAEVLSPAVVNIGSTRHVPGGVPFPEGPEGTPLDDMLEDLNPNNGLGPEAMQEASSLGSGFIISDDGYIVTNNHVVEAADEIIVYLTDGTRWPAKVVGSDDKVDLAVLKIEAGHKLPFVEFGDSDTAKVGDWVMAIGNPFGLGGSVTLGIVSARNRNIESGPYDQFIQTDAAINQGNSGGPLFDMDGKVVGINSAIIARGGGSLGIGFAIPGNLARPVVSQLEQFGETRRGWLGVSIQGVTEEIASSLGLPNTDGAIAVVVTKDGPADGVVKEGDLILEFDGKPIHEMRDLPFVVAGTEIGKPVDVKVVRDGKDMTLKITVGRLEEGEKLMDAQAKQKALGDIAPEDQDDVAEVTPPTLFDIVGLEVGAIDDAARKKFSIDKDVEGVIITKVDPTSDSSKQGLVEGLVITEVTQQPVATVDAFQQKVDAAKEAGRPTVLFKIAGPTGQTRYIGVRLR